MYTGVNMELVVTLVQVVIALGILNVWLLRRDKPTEYRGGKSQNMKQEFSQYGLPNWMFTAVGVLKVSLAVLLLVGIWIKPVALFSAVIMATLMLSAVVLHFKIKDPVKKSIPALTMLVLCCTVVATLA